MPFIARISPCRLGRCFGALGCYKLCHFFAALSCPTCRALPFIARISSCRLGRLSVHTDVMCYAYVSAGSVLPDLPRLALYCADFSLPLRAAFGSHGCYGLRLCFRRLCLARLAAPCPLLRGFLLAGWGSVSAHSAVMGYAYVSAGSVLPDLPRLALYCADFSLPVGEAFLVYYAVQAALTLI